MRYVQFLRLYKSETKQQSTVACDLSISKQSGELGITSHAAAVSLVECRMDDSGGRLRYSGQIEIWDNLKLSEGSSIKYFTAAQQ